MPFSWDMAKERTIKKAIDRAIILAGGKQSDSLANTDFKILHPDWVSQANKKDFTVLSKTIRENMKKVQDRALERRAKIAPKR